MTNFADTNIKRTKQMDKLTDSDIPSTLKTEKTNFRKVEESFKEELMSRLIETIQHYITPVITENKQEWHYLVPDASFSFSQHTFLIKGNLVCLDEIYFNNYTFTPKCNFKLKDDVLSLSETNKKVEQEFQYLSLDYQIAILEEVIDSFKYLVSSHIAAYNYNTKKFVEANNMLELSKGIELSVDDIFAIAIHNIPTQNKVSIYNISINDWIIYRENCLNVFKRDTEEGFWYPRRTFQIILTNFLYNNSIETCLENHPKLFSEAQVFFKQPYLQDEIVLVDLSSKKKLTFYDCEKDLKDLGDFLGKTEKGVLATARQPKPKVIISPKDNKPYAIFTNTLYTKKLWRNMLDNYKVWKAKKKK